MKILIVDDSKVMRSIVKRNLRQAGYGDADIVEAGNGKEALDAVKAAPPQLILSDWNMPEMNGIEFLVQLRADGFPIPFGFITSEGTDDMRQKGLDAGASFFVIKPFTPEDLKEAIARVG